MATDIASLADEDLREQLIGYGINVGPIVSTTRLFYEKKLGKLIDSGGVPQQPETEESEEEEEEEEEEEVDEEIQFKHKQQEQYVPRPAMKPQYTSTPVTQSQNYTPITQARVATPTTATRRNVTGQPDRPTATTTNRPKPSQGAEGKRGESGGGISMWLKLLFVVIVAFLIYLVIINMNPSAENRIPLTYEDNV